MTAAVRNPFCPRINSTSAQGSAHDGRDGRCVKRKRHHAPRDERRHIGQTRRQRHDHQKQWRIGPAEHLVVAVPDGGELGCVFCGCIVGGECSTFEGQMRCDPEHDEVVDDRMPCRVHDPEMLNEAARQHRRVTEYNDESDDEDAPVHCRAAVAQVF
jgi:hypothetical protein